MSCVNSWEVVTLFTKVGKTGREAVGGIDDEFSFGHSLYQGVCRTSVWRVHFGSWIQSSEEKSGTVIEIRHSRWYLKHGQRIEMPLSINILLFRIYHLE